MTPPLTDDAERRFVLALRRQDARAFAEFVRHFEGQVYAVALRMLGHRREDALDVSQEVFVAVWRAGPGFRAESRLSTWLHRVTLNLCRNRLRSFARRRDGRHDPLSEDLDDHSASVPLSGEVPGPHAVAEGNEAERLLRAALATLDPDHREVLILRELEGLDYDEIATITGAKLGTVKSRLSRAREALEVAFRAQRDRPGNSRPGGGV